MPSSRQASLPPNQTTAFSSQGGCLSGFLIPPLMVICVGAALAFAWLSSGTSTTLAASGQTNALYSQATLAQLTTPTGPSRVSSAAISPVFSPEIQYWGNSIQTWAAAAGLDPNLAATVMQIESCGNPRALSRAGAMGLFQVMPGHFTASDDPYNPATNALRGLAYLKRSLTAAKGNATLALAGYNGGIGVIGRPESTWQPETQHYAALGGAIYSDASSGATVSARLQAWLTAGGGSFCRQARTRLGISP